MATYMNNSGTINPSLSWFEFSNELDTAPESMGVQLRLDGGSCSLKLWSHYDNFEDQLSLNKEQLLALSEWAKEAAEVCS